MLARLSSMDVKRVLDLDGTGFIDPIVLARSLQIWDGTVFTEDAILDFYNFSGLSQVTALTSENVADVRTNTEQPNIPICISDLGSFVCSQAPRPSRSKNPRYRLEGSLADSSSACGSMCGSETASFAAAPRSCKTREPSTSRPPKVPRSKPNDPGCSRNRSRKPKARATVDCLRATSSASSARPSSARPSSARPSSPSEELQAEECGLAPRTPSVRTTSELGQVADEVAAAAVEQVPSGCAASSTTGLVNNPRASSEANIVARVSTPKLLAARGYQHQTVAEASAETAPQAAEAAAPAAAADEEEAALKSQPPAAEEDALAGPHEEEEAALKSRPPAAEEDAQAGPHEESRPAEVFLATHLAEGAARRVAAIPNIGAVSAGGLSVDVRRLEVLQVQPLKGAQETPANKARAVSPAAPSKVIAHVFVVNDRAAKVVPAVLGSAEDVSQMRTTMVETGAADGRSEAAPRVLQERQALAASTVVRTPVAKEAATKAASSSGKTKKQVPATLEEPEPEAEEEGEWDGSAPETDFSGTVTPANVSGSGTPVPGEDEETVDGVVDGAAEHAAAHFAALFAAGSEAKPKPVAPPPPPEPRVVARLANLNILRALDIDGSGMIDRDVLKCSLQIFDPDVFTEEACESLIYAALRDRSVDDGNTIRILDLALFMGAPVLYPVTSSAIPEDGEREAEAEQEQEDEEEEERRTLQEQFPQPRLPEARPGSAGQLLRLALEEDEWRSASGVMHTARTEVESTVGDLSTARVNLSELQAGAPGCVILRPEMRGITLRQLKRLMTYVEERCEREYWYDPETEQLLTPDIVDMVCLREWVLKPATKERRCSFVELIASRPRLQQPSWYVSPCSGPVKTFVHCLMEHAKRHKLSDDVSYWVEEYSRNLWEEHVPDNTWQKALAISQGSVQVIGEGPVAYVEVGGVDAEDAEDPFSGAHFLSPCD